MIIDGHAHACGQYLTAKALQLIMDDNKIDYTVLIPGELNSITTYKFKDYTLPDPYKDPVIKTIRLTRFATGITNMKSGIPKGNDTPLLSLV